MFNVGQVALMIVRQDEIDVYYRWTQAVSRYTDKGVAVRYSKRSVNAPIRCVSLPLGAPFRISRALRSAHRAAIRAAAQAKANSPWAYAHSPGVLALLRVRRHGPVPDPAYAHSMSSAEGSSSY